jgi:hypothetical protein
MVLLVVSSTVRYKKSSLRLCATYGPDYIVNENNSVTTTMDVTGTMGHKSNESREWMSHMGKDDVSPS